MTSELKSATPKTGGPKSRGPKSAETPEISSHNSPTDEFIARKTIVLECESDNAFQEMLDHYAATYQPGSLVEQDLVNEMVVCRWRMQRLRMIETALLDSEMNRDEPEPEPTPADPGYQLAFAFRQKLPNEPTPMPRSSARKDRQHLLIVRHRSFRQLKTA